MSKGTLKADELRIAKITVDMLTNPSKVQALFALIDSKTGRTLAWSEGQGNMWSHATIDKLKELRQAMEDDAAAILLEGGSTASTTTGGLARVGGIGEHLGNGESEVPSV